MFSYSRRFSGFLLHPIFPSTVGALSDPLGTCSIHFLPLTPCWYFALYDITTTIYEALLWDATSVLLLFIVAQWDRLTLHSSLQSFKINFCRLQRHQSVYSSLSMYLCVCLNPQDTHTHTSVNFGNKSYSLWLITENCQTCFDCCHSNIQMCSISL